MVVEEGGNWLGREEDGEWGRKGKVVVVGRKDGWGEGDGAPGKIGVAVVERKRGVGKKEWEEEVEEEEEEEEEKEAEK